MAQAYFFLIVLGFPVTLLVVAGIAGHFHRQGTDGVLDWKPTRSPRKEAELYVGEIDHMLAALNKYRRLRGAPELSLEEVALRAASSELDIGTPPPPDRS